MIRYNCTRLGNGHFLIKLLEKSLDRDEFESPERTLLTLELTEDETRELISNALDEMAALDEERGQ